MKRKLINIISFLIFFYLLVFCYPALAQDQGALKLSITPPLFKINMDPGETWSSTVKLVNNNTYPITVYAEVLDFKSGSTGGVEFIKDSAGGANKGSLSGWVEINREPVVIGSQESAELPFFIKLPADASPGGHYAAILAGSKPPEGKTEGSEIKISSMLASLLLVRVGGEVVEQGEIKEFSVDRSLSWDLSAKLHVSFANTGNTHLQPAGEIKISNMWGEQRAAIPINQKSNFGNVLPESEKRWEFSWKGSNSILDAGRMRADLVIGFGEEATQTDASTIYFWTLSLKPTAIVLGVIILLLLIIVLLIRRYINKSLRQVKAQAERLLEKEKLLQNAATGRGGTIVNLRKENKTLEVSDEEERLTWSMFKRVTIFLIIIILAASMALAFYYFGGFRQVPAEPEAQKTENYPAETAEMPAAADNQQDGATAISSPEGKATSTDAETMEPAVSSSTASTTENAEAAEVPPGKKIVKVNILNGGGVRGAAARASELIKSAETEIVSLGNADNFDYQTTQIRYKIDAKAQAETINSFLGGKAELIEDGKIVEDVVVVLGKNFK